MPTKHGTGFPVYVDTNNWTRENLAWAAGFFEGDGSVGVYSDGSPHGHLQICQKVPEALETFRDIVGTGAIRFHKSRNYHVWQEGRKRATYAVAVALYPWLSNRRQERIRDLITNIFGETA